jgi:hypothetical protein
MVLHLKHWFSRDLVSTALNQMWRVVSGPVTLVLIPLLLTPELQGYWFTIFGLSFLMLFADLGFSNIILQFAAHEFAYLRFDGGWKITGDEEHLRKLATFFKFSVKWALFVIVLMIPVISAVSFFVLTRKASDIHWFLPWLIYLTASIFVFFNNMLLYFFEGCGLVWLSQRIRFGISILLSVTMWAGLLSKIGLYALAFSLLISAVANSAVIYAFFRRTIGQFFAITREHHYSWKEHFFPLLWRYAISFTSGYFVFQLYTPLMFYFRGPVDAGRVGISCSLWMAVYSIASVWITAVTPRINMHISRKERSLLDRLFLQRTWLSALTFLMGAAAFFVFFHLFIGRLSILGRFADETSLIILSASWFFQTIINALAVYLRAHKEEPLVLPSFCSAVWVIISTVLCVIYLPSKFFFLGFLTNYIWSVPWVVILFLRKQKAMAEGPR